MAMRDRKWKCRVSAAAIERWIEVMRWLPSVPRSRRHPQAQSQHRRACRTRTAQWSADRHCLNALVFRALQNKRHRTRPNFGDSRAGL